MNKVLFDELLESVHQMDEIQKGERAPSRKHLVPSMQIRDIRKKSGLPQKKFAELINVQLGTLRNWEQGRREPTGPARALIRAISQDPEHVIAALNQE